jgi:sulfite exporter TauE/SafE/copper chaperone CopZ
MSKRKKTGLKTDAFVAHGMECGACEKIIQRQVKTIDGVARLSVDYVSGKGEVTYDPRKTDINEIFERISDKGYSCRVSGSDEPRLKKPINYIPLILGSVILLFAGYYLFRGLSTSIPALDENTSILLLFTVGLLTGFHCIAMCGGFVVSYSSKDALTRGGLNLRSHLAYGFGKTLSYTVIGAVFGFIGSYLTFTPFMRGMVAVLAGVFLILFGFNMLDVFTWFRKYLLKTPGFIERIASRQSGKNSSPLVIGLLNGLMIACGPLQAMYLFAAASGSAYYGARALFVFGLGTLPVLLGFGVLTSVISSRLTSRIVRFSGVAVILLGLIMLNRGLMLMGSGYDASTVLLSVSDNKVTDNSTTPAININSGGFQEIRMNVTRYGWQPAKFVLKKGVPVKWIIDGQELTSCNNAIQVPKLKLRFDIKPGLQTIEFTPNEAGTIPWSCWMGMIPGVFVVKEEVNTNSPEAVKAELQNIPVPSGGSCGGGGGGGCGGSCGGGCGCGVF